MNIRIQKKFSKYGCKDKVMRKFSVARLQGACEDARERELPRVHLCPLSVST